MCGFYSFSPPPHVFYLWCVWCDTKSSNHSIPKPHLTPETLISAPVNFPSSPFHHIAVCSGVFLLALSSSSSFLGEGANAFGARRGNSPARRGDRGEIRLPKRSPDNIPASIWVTKHSSNFFLLSHCSNLSWCGGWSHLPIAVAIPSSASF